MSNVLNTKGPPPDLITRPRTPDYSTTGIGDSAGGIVSPFQNNPGIYSGGSYYDGNYFGAYPYQEHPAPPDEEGSDNIDCTAYLYGESPEQSPFDRGISQPSRIGPVFDGVVRFVNRAGRTAGNVYDGLAKIMLPAIRAIDPLTPHAAEVSALTAMIAGATLFAATKPLIVFLSIKSHRSSDTTPKSSNKGLDPSHLKEEINEAMKLQPFKYHEKSGVVKPRLEALVKILARFAGDRPILENGPGTAVELIKEAREKGITIYWKESNDGKKKLTERAMAGLPDNIQDGIKFKELDEPALSAVSVWNFPLSSTIDEGLDYLGRNVGFNDILVIQTEHIKRLKKLLRESKGWKLIYFKEFGPLDWVIPSNVPSIVARHSPVGFYVIQRVGENAGWVKSGMMPPDHPSRQGQSKPTKLPKPSMDKLLSIKKNGLCCSSVLVESGIDEIPSADGYGSSGSQKGAIVTFPDLKTEFEKDSMGKRLPRNNRYYLWSDARLSEVLERYEKYISSVKEKGKIPYVDEDVQDLFAAAKVDKERKWDRCNIKTNNQKHTFSFEKIYGTFAHKEGISGRMPTEEEFKDEMLDDALYDGASSIFPVIMERAPGPHELFGQDQKVLEERAANSIVFLVDMDKLDKVELIKDSMEIRTADKKIAPENIGYILVPDNLWETVNDVFHEDQWRGKLIRVGYTTANIHIGWNIGVFGLDGDTKRRRTLSDAKIPDYKRAIKEIAKNNPDKMYFAHGSRLLTPNEVSNDETTHDPDPGGIYEKIRENIARLLKEKLNLNSNYMAELKKELEREFPATLDADSTDMWLRQMFSPREVVKLFETAQQMGKSNNKPIEENFYVLLTAALGVGLAEGLPEGRVQAKKLVVAAKALHKLRANIPELNGLDPSVQSLLRAMMIVDLDGEFLKWFANADMTPDSIFNLFQKIGEELKILKTLQPNDRIEKITKIIAPHLPKLGAISELLSLMRSTFPDATFRADMKDWQYFRGILFKTDADRLEWIARTFVEMAKWGVPFAEREQWLFSELKAIGIDMENGPPEKGGGGGGKGGKGGGGLTASGLFGRDNPFKLNTDIGKVDAQSKSAARAFFEGINTYIGQRGSISDGPLDTNPIQPELAKVNDKIAAVSLLHGGQASGGGGLRAVRGLESAFYNLRGKVWERLASAETITMDDYELYISPLEGITAEIYDVISEARKTIEAHTLDSGKEWQLREFLYDFGGDVIFSISKYRKGWIEMIKAGKPLDLSIILPVHTNRDHDAIAKQMFSKALQVFNTNAGMPLAEGILKRVIDGNADASCPLQKIGAFFKNVLNDHPDPAMRYYLLTLLDGLVTKPGLVSEDLYTVAITALKDSSIDVVYKAWDIIWKKAPSGIRAKLLKNITDESFAPPKTGSIEDTKRDRLIADLFFRTLKTFKASGAVSKERLTPINPVDEKMLRLKYEALEKIIAEKLGFHFGPYIKDPINQKIINGYKAGILKEFFELKNPGATTTENVKVLRLLDDNSERLYLIDGQHRVAALIKAAEEGIIPAEWLESIPATIYTPVTYTSKGILPKAAIKRFITMNTDLTWDDVIPKSAGGTGGPSTGSTGSPQAGSGRGGKSGMVPVDHPAKQKKAFINKVKKLEQEMFPQECGNPQETFFDGPLGYSYFYPSRHFGRGLLTEEIVDSFIQNKGKKMLNVGAGGGHLERLLVRLGVNANQIHLTDKNSDFLPTGFKTYVFDMFLPWPALETKYDLVIFAESYVPAHLDDPVYKKTPLYQRKTMKGEDLYHLIKKALEHVKVDGEIRILNPVHNEVVKIVKEKLKIDGYELEEAGIALLVIRKKTSALVDNSLKDIFKRIEKINSLSEETPPDAWRPQFLKELAGSFVSRLKTDGFDGQQIKVLEIGFGDIFDIIEAFLGQGVEVTASERSNRARDALTLTSSKKDWVAPGRLHIGDDEILKGKYHVIVLNMPDPDRFSLRDYPLVDPHNAYIETINNHIAPGGYLVVYTEMPWPFIKAFEDDVSHWERIDDVIKTTRNVFPTKYRIGSNKSFGIFRNKDSGGPLHHTVQGGRQFRRRSNIAPSTKF